MAGIVTEEVAVAVPADRLWKMMAPTSPIMLKACAGYIDDVEVEGQGVGSVVTFKYNASLHAHLKQSKNRLLAIDEAARVVKSEVLEAGVVTAQLKTQVAELKVEAAGDEGASVLKVKVDYERKDGAALAPEDQAKLTLVYVKIAKMAEAYHAAHPDELA